MATRPNGVWSAPRRTKPANRACIDPAAHMREIQQRVRAATDLDCSVGIGENRLQAKLATGFLQAGRQARRTMTRGSAGRCRSASRRRCRRAAAPRSPGRHQGALRAVRHPHPRAEANRANLGRGGDRASRPGCAGPVHLTTASAVAGRSSRARRLKTLRRS